MTHDLLAIEERTSRSGRVSLRRDGRGVTVTIRQVRRGQRVGVGVLLTAVVGIVALMIGVGDPAATGALLVPLAFCLGGLWHFFLRRTVRVRVGGESVHISRWRKSRPMATGPAIYFRATTTKLSSDRVVRLTYEGELLLEIFPMSGDEVALIHAVLRHR